MLEGLFDLKRWELAFVHMDTFWDGFGVTLHVVVAGLALALALGTLLGVFSTTRSRILRGISRVYVEFYQNTPLPVQVLFMYMAGPQFLQAITGAPQPVRIAPFVLGTLGVGLYHAAYIAEVIRTGIEAVPRGQVEAAQSQGFSRIQTYAYIVLPQTFKIILPPLCNQALNLVKNTSVLALVAGGDLMYRSDNFVSLYGYLQGYIICCFMYFIICFPLAMLVQWLEKRSKARPRAKSIPGVTDVAAAAGKEA
ncbi:MAG: amino acid ABC transporter permease [Coriobacteriaceae bacterium]|nr:amino acid ABC transporter permease [Coriobacteriaceae bacterium]